MRFHFKQEMCYVGPKEDLKKKSQTDIGCVRGVRQEGVNMKKNPVGDENVKGDDKAFKKANIGLYQWPWDQ